MKWAFDLMVNDEFDHDFLVFRPSSIEVLMFFFDFFGLEGGGEASNPI